MSATSGDHGHYYVPHSSYWPIIAAVGMFTLLGGLALSLHSVAPGPWLLICGGAILTWMFFGWFRTVIGESEGKLYNNQVDLSFRMSMGWFIFSEVMFFGVFFGALFYSRVLAVPWLTDLELLWPGYEGGWPNAGPLGPEYIGPDRSHIQPGQFSSIGAWGIPVLNTALLLSSSLTVTIAHWALKENQRGKLIFWLALTVILGALFVYFQASEYIHAYGELGLTLGTGIYGATFFMLTGFHGLHVTIGAIVLLVIWLRCVRGHFKPDHHFAFEAGAWYWHFVDTVWVGLFIFVYIL